MGAPLWTLEAVVEATGGSHDGRKGEPIKGVSIDTRTLDAGDLFIAIRGDNRDGHGYVRKAFENGAAAALVETRFQGGGADGVLVRVPDTLKAMGALARAARDRTNARVIAVTGSVGKTGTKEMLRLALSHCGRVHAAEKSYNNHWGVPLTLSRMPADTDYAVCEIGMNHAGEISPLTKMVRPHVALVTAVAPVHIGGLGSLEAVARAKSEIFEGLEPGGIAIVNAGAPHADILRAAASAHGAEIRTFGGPGAHAEILNAEPEGGRTLISARIGENEVAYHVGAPGEHHACNSLAALTAVQAAGGDIAIASTALVDFHAQPGRGASETFALPGGDVVLIDESYNANPASVGAAISTLSETGTPGARRIAVLGDMLELGDMSVELHSGLATPLMESGIDLIFTCGPHMAALHETLPETMRGANGAGPADLVGPLTSMVAPGDVVMVKGSLGSRMGPLVDALRTHLTGIADA